ncbi:methyl-accepting chemotaxis protein, partial [Nitriliruptoraceae bacterium ZYF776]|nr:methyl-accepting chemotaxis protein [Profundirhabdus halotolerans]
MKLDRLALRHRLLGGLTVIVLALAVAVAVVLVRMGAVDHAVDEAQVRSEQLARAADVSDNVLQLSRLGVWAIADANPDTVAAIRELVPAYVEGMTVATDRIEELALGQRARDLVADLRATNDEIEAVVAQQLSMVEAGELDAARQVLATTALDAVTASGEAVTATTTYLSGALDDGFATAHHTYEGALKTGIALAILALSLAAGVGTYLVRSLGRAVRRSAEDVTGSSEQLAAVASQVGAAAEETATQSNVVAAAGEQVSHNVQTVATAVEEMSASVREIAQSSGEASRVASEAVRTAEATNENVAR